MKHPALLSLSLGGGSKLEGCGPRVNAFLLYYATQLEPNPPPLPSSNRLGKFRSTVIQTRVQPKKNAMQRVYMYIYIYRSFFDPFFFFSSSNGFFSPFKLSFLPSFLFQNRENFSLEARLNERLFIELCPFRWDACKHGWNEWKGNKRRGVERDSRIPSLSLSL